MLSQRHTDTQTDIPTTRTASHHLSIHPFRTIPPGEAAALADLGEPLSSSRHGDHVLLHFTDDYWALVGPDVELSPAVLALLARSFDIDLFEAQWEAYEGTLVTKFLRIL